MNRWLVSMLAMGCSSAVEPRAAPPVADLESTVPEARFDVADCDVIVPLDQPTVQDGIDDAIDGQTVCIEAGTWVETLALSGRTLTVRGAGAGRTRIDGGGAGSTILMEDSVVELSDLAIVGGSSLGEGGGIRVEELTLPTELTLRDVTVADNTAVGDGGGLFVMHAGVVAERVRFVRNVTGSVGGGICLHEGRFEGTEVVIDRNRAGAGGGGADAGRSRLALENSSVRANVDASTAGGGGGLRLFTTVGPVVDTVIAGNTSGAHGGGVAIAGYDDVAFENVVIAGNSAPTGGAISVDGAALHVAVTNSAIVGNVATVSTGGVWLAPYNTFGASHADLWGNGVNVNGPDPVGTDGNVGVPPRFVWFRGLRPMQWDFHLRPASPLIDAGDPLILDPDGTVSDIGAYGGPLALP